MAIATGYPTTDTAVTGSWTNPANVQADDNAVAVLVLPATKNSEGIRELGGFGFDSSVPSGATINSVTLEVEHRVTTISAISTLGSRLRVGTTDGTEQTDTAEPTTLTARSYASLAKPGGGSWTRADLLNGTLKARIRGNNGNSATTVNCEWDYVRIKVDYSTPSGVASRVFNGSADYIKTAMGNVVGTGAFTFAALVRLNSALGVGANVVALNLSHSVNGGQGSLGLVEDTGVYYVNVVATGGGTYSTSVSLATSVWAVIVGTHASGTDAGTMHRGIVSTGAWTHGVGWTTRDNLAASDGIFLGGWNAVSNFWPGEIAAGAIWDRQLSQAEVISLLTNKKTQDWADVSGGAPKALWDLNQVSVATSLVDLIGDSDQLAITGTSVGADGPLGWTFGVSGGTGPTLIVPKRRLIKPQAIHRASRW